jgi:hypothetical protein
MGAPLNPSQKGDAGEYAAAAELAVRGWTVDMPRRGAKGIDLYARSPIGGRTCGVQVKTRSRGDFAFKPNLLELVDAIADEWVILVTLKDPGTRCDFHVVPRNHVTAALLAYKGYLDLEGKSWPRMMFGEAEFAGYREAWNLMERPAPDAAWGMPNWIAVALGEHNRDDVFDALPGLRRP